MSDSVRQHTQQSVRLKRVTASQKKSAPHKTEKYTYKRRSFEGLERLTKEVRAITRPILGKRGFSGFEIIENWTEIIGEDLALGIQPEKLTFEKQSRINGTLYVKSAGGAFALLFEHHKQQVIDRINSFFGYPAVSFVRITQGKLNLNPLPKENSVSENEFSSMEIEALKEKTSLIEDENLRRIFYQMGLIFLRKNHR